MRLHAARSLLALAAALALAACGGGGGAALVPSSDVPPGPSLAVVQVLPAAADVRGGAQVTISGSGFETTNPPVLVRIGGRVVPVTPVSDTLIQVIVPPGDAVGTVPLGIISGSGLADLAGGFTYLASPPTPPALACEPAVGQAGTIVQLTVTNFAALASPSVTLGGIACPGLTVVDATRVRVQVPAGLAGSMEWPMVLTQGGSSVTAQGFYVQDSVPAGDLVINEFLADPGTLDANRDGTPSSSSDEFVELVNRRSVAVDITGWVLADGTGTRHVFPNPTTIPAGGSLVVFGGGWPMFFPPAHASGHAQAATTGDLGLNNSGSESILLRTPGATVIAQVDYVTSAVASGRSRNAATDGGEQPVPAAGSTYALHDTLPGALGTASPGARIGGSGF